jgi:hypothetical protein
MHINVNSPQIQKIRFFYLRVRLVQYKPSPKENAHYSKLIFAWSGKEKCRLLKNEKKEIKIFTPVSTVSYAP